MHRLESFDKFGKIIADFRSVGLTITPLLGFVLITYASLFSVFVCCNGHYVCVCVYVSVSVLECFASFSM